MMQNLYLAQTIHDEYEERTRRHVFLEKIRKETRDAERRNRPVRPAATGWMKVTKLRRLFAG